MRAWGVVLGLAWTSPGVAQETDEDAVQRPVVEEGPLVLPAVADGPPEVLPPGFVGMLRDRPVALVIRGGASLGTYEAGYLYAATHALQALHAEDGGAAYDVVTGASAGALNTLLAAVSSCRAPVDDPEQSLFWAWTRVHVDPLGRSEDPWNAFRRRETGATHALSRQPFDEAVEQVRAVLEDPAGWLDRPCELDLGFVISRLRAREVPMRSATFGEITASRQTEKIVVRFQRTAAGGPVFTPVVPVASDGAPSPARPLYLHLGHGAPGEPLPFEDVAAVLAASSGFPFAFSEVAVPHREWRLDGTLESSFRTTRARFVDGGLLENLPVRLAKTVAQWRAWEGRAERPWRSFLVVDPDVENWQRRGGTRSYSAHFQPNAVQLGMALARSYVKSTQDAELLQALDDDPDLMRSPTEPDADGVVRDRLLLPGRRTIPASQWAGAFMGLFEEDFRIFDFHLGMLEARAELARIDPAIDAALAPGTGIDSDLHACFVAWDRASEGFTREQVRVEEPVACARFDRTGTADRLARGNLVPLLRTATAFRRWTESVHYDPRPDVQFDTWVALLDANGFRWQSLRHSGDGDDIARQIRDFLLRASHRMAARQGRSSLLVLAGARLAANSYAYRPPRVLPFVGLHLGWGIEAGLGVGAGRWLRPVVGLKVLELGRQTDDLGGSRVGTIQPTPFVRLEATPMRSAFFSVEPWVAYGTQLPVAFDGRLVGIRHALSAGVHLVALEWIYGTLGAGGIVAQEASPGFDVAALDGLTGRVVVDVSLGLRVPF
ncbi:MAG: patatin-like phospholipase family protein [Alphaproteobacteria bacterium]|nr:patatin-like phospholipase family protein [Alphaproteobacteria bacterium]